MKIKEFTGKTTKEAIDNGLAELGVTIADVHVDVLQEGAKGLFGLFGFIGLLPNTALYEGQVNMENGYIPTDDNMHTNLDGVYAAGDLRVKSLRQVVTAAADGAIAAMQAEKYIADHKE